MVVLPAAVNIAAGLLHPLPSRVEMITAQREASNDAVNRRSELLARYLEDHPEMAGGVVAEESGRAALAWAATDAVNQHLEEVTAVHDARRAEQLALVRRYRFLSPALLAQEVLVDAAGTGDARFARFDYVWSGQVLSPSSCAAAVSSSSKHPNRTRSSSFSIVSSHTRAAASCTAS